MSVYEDLEFELRQAAFEEAQERAALEGDFLSLCATCPDCGEDFWTDTCPVCEENYECLL